jgi:hypothetical protein
MILLPRGRVCNFVHLVKLKSKKPLFVDICFAKSVFFLFAFFAENDTAQII